MRRHFDRGDIAVGGEQRAIRRRLRYAAHGCACRLRRARRSRRSVQSRAASASRQTGWLAASPGDLFVMRWRRRNSSSLWKAARRLICARMPATPSSSSTSKLPVEEPMKTLMPAQPGSFSKSPRCGRIVPRAAHVEGEIAIHAVAWRARTLSARASAVTVSGLGIGHFEDAGDAAHDGGAAAGFQVFLVFGAGLAQMHLAVDHAGQDVQARCSRWSRAACVAANCPMPTIRPARDGDIALAHPIMIDDGSTLENEISRAVPSGFP